MHQHIPNFHQFESIWSILGIIFHIEDQDTKLAYSETHSEGKNGCLSLVLVCAAASYTGSLETGQQTALRFINI